MDTQIDVGDDTARDQRIRYAHLLGREFSFWNIEQDGYFGAATYSDLAKAFEEGMRTAAVEVLSSRGIWGPDV